MWSHYADSHKGFCIGFKNIRTFLTKDACKVIYTPNRPHNLLNRYREISRVEPEARYLNTLNSLVLTKGTGWAYEEEWRIISEQKELTNYTSTHVDCIIFGMHMLIEHRNKLKALLEGKNVKYFETKKSLQILQLNFNPWNNNCLIDLGSLGYS